ncbi:MAG: nucleoside kinase [Alistipes sp.]|nr:nucleoside kinase [Alistipes sp.]
MRNAIKVYCVNCDRSVEVEMGTSLVELLDILELRGERPYLAAVVNHRVKELNYKIYTPVKVEFEDITSAAGFRTYQRSLVFIMQAVVSKLYPSQHFYLRHSIGDSLYCEVEGKESFSEAECRALYGTAQSIVASALPITSEKIPTAEAIEEFKRRGMNDKIDLLTTREKLYSTIKRMGEEIGYFFGALAPSTACIDRFEVRPYHRGFYLSTPTRTSPNVIPTAPNLDKMFRIFDSYNRWVNILGVPTIGKLNQRIRQGDAGELIQIGEAVHAKLLSNIADQIALAHRERGLRLILISGPSSSGKTTTSKRLGVQLRVLGLQPVLVSTDDYFVNREDTPRDENGDYDFEVLEAIDLARLNEDLGRLMAGESVEIPRFDFVTGRRQWHEKPLQLEENSVLIMEGIHALNPRLTPSIPADAKFKIYASCLTSVALDNTSRIHTTDNRLLRRMIRDNATRGTSAADTIARWGSVRRGEERHIFPYQEEADVMFNSSLIYELSVLKPFAEPLLREIPNASPEYATAQGLLKFLDNFVPIVSQEIPPTSVLREFVGGSAFKY